MKIYTKTGDKGQTSLVGGTRVPKSDVRINAYGTIDELNSFIGLLHTYITDKHIADYLLYIQNVLFSVGASLATDREKKKQDDLSEIKSFIIEELELQIDKLNTLLPPLEAFVLPGGAHEVAICHVCRTVTRRAERILFNMMDENFFVDKNIPVLINRLSDYFFVLSRYLSSVNRCSEENYWTKLSD